MYGLGSRTAGGPLVCAYAGETLKAAAACLKGSVDAHVTKPTRQTNCATCVSKLVRRNRCEGESFTKVSAARTSYSLNSRTSSSLSESPSTGGARRRGTES